jgi:hypothetical protein
MYEALNAELEMLKQRLAEANAKAKQPKGVSPEKVKEREAKAFAKGVAAAHKNVEKRRQEVRKQVFGETR